MEKISIARKKRIVIVLLLLFSFPISLLIPTVSSSTSNYDVNSDGLCNILDIVQVATHLGESGSSGWIREDADKNGHINMLDMIFVSNYYGTSADTEEDSPTSFKRIQKMSICYSGRIYLTAQQQYIAEHFDLVDTDPNAGSTIQSMKATNPNLKAIAYYDTIFSGSGQAEDWYIHRSGTSTRVTSSGSSSLYVVNPNSGWVNYYISRAKGVSPVYDGIFLDDYWYDPSYDNEYWSVSPSNWEISMNVWKNHMVQFAYNVKSNLSSKIALANVPMSTGAVSTICDQTHAIFVEHFVHRLETSVTDNGRSVSAILSSIDQLHAQTVKGDIIAVVSGCNAGTGYEDWAKFCYACFAFAVDDPSKAYFAWNFMGSSPTTNPTWFQWMDDYVLGSPTDNYHSISGNVYGRTFANYYVLANLNNLGTYTTFTFHDTSYTLEGKHALFILK